VPISGKVDSVTQNPSSRFFSFPRLKVYITTATSHETLLVGSPKKNKKHHFSQQLRRAPPPITASNTIITISHIALPAAFVSRLSLQSIVLCSRVPRPQLKLLRSCSAFVPELLATNLQPYCSLRPLTVPQLYLLPIRPTIDAPFAPLDLERQRRSTLSPVRSNSPRSRRRF